MYQPLPPDPASDSPARQRRSTLIFSLPALLVVCALLAGTAQAPVAKAVATATSQDLSPTERQRRDRDSALSKRALFHRHGGALAHPFTRYL